MMITWLIMLCCCCIAASSLISIAAAQTNISTDQSALLALKAHITSDPHNLIFPNWSTTTPVCNWVGVTCGARHRRVAALNLLYFDLQGTIPPHLGNLSFLVYIGFMNNSFHGPLPQELARLRRLKFLSFTSNKLMGIIPTWIGSFSNLQTLSLYGNKFSGSIPASVFNLSALQMIDLRYNQLSGTIPREIGNLTLLKKISLDGNRFVEIPKEIGNLDQLEKLFAQEIGLEGNVPIVVFNMSSLTTLTLSGNNLKGRLPDDMCQNLPHIQELYFDYNQLEGPLPTVYRHCKSLVILNLWNNKITGSIPNNIGNATQLQSINLKENNLAGTIPYEIGCLPNLMEVALQFNILKGHIPASIFNMSKVKIIYLMNNQLSGNLSPSISFNLPNLQWFNVGNNDLSGEIPKSIANSSQLIFLQLSGNSLSGFIPSTLCVLTNLQIASLSVNSLVVDTSSKEANFLSCLPNLQKLINLAFGNNPLNAQLPVSFFRNLSTSLQRVYLNNCSLRGNIPEDMGNLSSLIALYMDDNSLSGSIPTSLGDLRNLQGLYLSNNQLQGHIPGELCQQHNLAELWLDKNRLSGPIPSCLGQSITSLRHLSLRSNLLNSTIPSTLWKLTDLLHLDLSSNSLSGFISEEVGKLKSLTNFNLSNNRFSGGIPSSIGNLQMLQSLYLEKNNLEGPIPSSLANSLSLVVLNLSNNNLSGMIPKSLDTLMYLKSLDLSFNKLQGEIPYDGPFQNFSAQSFASNGKLCGAPRFQVPTCKRSTSRRSNWKYIVIGIMLAMFVVTSIWIVILRKRNNVDATDGLELLPQLSWRRVSYNALVIATNSFDESNLLGSGGFGSVYKGTFSDGIDVAIKVFNLQLEGAFKSFSVECEILANIRHRNLIKIISCCSQPDFKAVVLNYMPNGSLDKWLYSCNLCLNILQRLNIMIDVALALEYLHYGYGEIIVHCDLKPSNILLEEDMSAHVADFGIAKHLCGSDLITQTITQATIGYMAPEYGMEGIVTSRGDVYSFGIVLMETFTGKKPTNDMFDEELSIKEWVATSSLLDIVDVKLQLTEENDQDFVKKSECLSSIMSLALACSANSPDERVNMQEALAMLNKIKIRFLSDAAGDVGLNGSHV